MSIRYAAMTAAAACLTLAGCDNVDISKKQDPGNASVDQAAAVPTYDAKTFFETVNVSLAPSAGFAFSQDEGSLLISSDETGVFNAYALASDGSATTPLTTGEDTTFAQSFFPDDDRILFTKDGGGDELNKLFVRAEDGSVTNLTPGEATKAAFLAWSGDGLSFFVLTNERDPASFDLYRYAADDYDRELVFENTEALQLDAISVDGTLLAATKNRNSADSDVFLIDLTADEPSPLLITEHEGNIAHGVYTFTPSGDALIYATNEFGEFNQAWRYDIESGEKSEFFTADWDVSFVGFSRSGRYLIAGINEDARTTLILRDQESGDDLGSFGVGAGSLGNIRFNRDETKIAAMLYRDTSPGNVVLLDIASNTSARLTDTLNPAIDEEHLVEAEVIRYPSFDGLEIPSILYRPHGATSDNPAPAVVFVHGGPGGQSRAGYSAMMQHLVNHGYVVLAANNRGSSGYGKTFFHMDDKRHGEVDLQDIVYARTWLEEQDWVDGDAIAIMGGSYGGYMVGAALAFEPEVFDAGINIFGVMNWVRTLKSIPPWWESFREALYDEMGDPETDEERHRAISPLFHADNIVKPLLVVQGANDPRVLQVESDEIVEAVRANGIPVDYIVFDDEGHGFRKRDNRIEAQEAYVTFLDTYLRDAPSE